MNHEKKPRCPTQIILQLYGATAVLYPAGLCHKGDVVLMKHLQKMQTKPAGMVFCQRGVRDFVEQMEADLLQ